MRAIITLLLVVSCGAAAMVVSSRASKAVDAKVGGHDGAAATSSTAITSLKLDLYDSAGNGFVVTAKPNQISFTGAVRSPKITPQDWAEIQAAFDAVPAKAWSPATGEAMSKRDTRMKERGGDYYLVTGGGGLARFADADGWRASDLDGIKAAIWRIVRRHEKPALQTDPKLKTVKGDEFVAPFEALRAALRIKF